jgi:hypothetical protein
MLLTYQISNFDNFGYDISTMPCTHIGMKKYAGQQSRTLKQKQKLYK